MIINLIQLTKGEQGSNALYKVSKKFIDQFLTYPILNNNNLYINERNLICNTIS
jgi:hypothetical protein